MNQIKQKVAEIGLSQREISVRLGKNPSYLAGVFRSGLSTAKQNELMDDLDTIANGGTILSDEKLLELVDDQLEKSYAQNEQLKAQLLLVREGNTQLRAESDRYFKDLQTAHQSYIGAQNAGIKALESYGIVQKQLTETQKYLLESNQEVEQIERKYRAVLIFNYLLSLVILGITITWVLV